MDELKLAELRFNILALIAARYQAEPLATYLAAAAELEKFIAPKSE